MANDITVHRSFQPGEILVEVVSVGLFGLTAAEVPIAPIAGLDAGTVQGALEGINEKSGLSQNKTIYVAESGNNATGDGSQNKPFRSIQKALDTVPKTLNGYAVTISLSAGNYDGFICRGFSGGALSINGINIKNAVKIVSTIACYNNSSTTTFSNLTFTGNYVPRCISCNNTNLYISICWFSGVNVLNEYMIDIVKSKVSLLTTVIENCVGAGMVLSNIGSDTYLQVISGTGNSGIGLYARGGTIRKGSSVTISATTEQVFAYGGNILP